MVQKCSRTVLIIITISTVMNWNTCIFYAKDAASIFFDVYAEDFEFSPCLRCLECFWFSLVSIELLMYMVHIEI